ncbi:ras-related protein Rab-39B-like [Watersipora subatra]|uniref:ras-related protein Rab-39B-like n=1 Tax=Watersipora subatra TaxID=2589382 RepID=UPI00355C6CA9
MEAVDPAFAYQFRLILIGNSMVGKSSLLKYFTQGKCPDVSEATVGVDFFAKVVEVDDKTRVKLQMWDTAGQERFRSITRTYYRNSVGVMMVYDITSRRSFEDMLDWLHEALKYIDPSKAVFVVVGHKSDMCDERVISELDGEMFASANGLSFVETSAVTGENVEKAFSMVSKQIYAMLADGRLKLEDGWDGIKRGYGSEVPETNFQLEDEQKKKGCCGS